MIRHLRSNLIAYLALFLALSGGSFAIAALSHHDKRVIKKIVNKQITRRAPGLTVNQANTANEATHASTADTAASVGGVSIEPVRFALPDGAPSTPVVSVNGTSVNLSQCGPGALSLRIARGASGPPVVAELVRSTAALHAVAFLQPPNGSTGFDDSAAGLSASIRESSGRVTRVIIDYFYDQNAFSGTDDCFVQGTIERFG